MCVCVYVCACVCVCVCVCVCGGGGGGEGGEFRFAIIFPLCLDLITLKGLGTVGLKNDRGASFWV